MKRVVKLLVELPDIDATESEINEHIEFELGYDCQIKTGNPFRGECLEILECYIEDREVIQ